MNLPITQITLPFENSKALTVDVIYTNNAFRLNLAKTTDYGKNIYAKNGTIEFTLIDLGQFYMKINKIDIAGSFPSTTSMKVYTCTSNNSISFSDYVALNPDGTINSPQARYLKLKIELTGGEEVLSILRNDFVNGDSIQFDADSEVTLDGSMYLKTSYEKNLIKDTNYNDGFIFSSSIGDYKKINKIEVK